MHVCRQCGVGGGTAGKAAVDRAPGRRRKTGGSHGPGTGPLVPGGLFHFWLPGLGRGPLPVVDSLNLPQLRVVALEGRRKRQLCYPLGTIDGNNSRHGTGSYFLIVLCRWLGRVDKPEPRLVHRIWCRHFYRTSSSLSLRVRWQDGIKSVLTVLILPLACTGDKLGRAVVARSRSLQRDGNGLVNICRAPGGGLGVL